MASNLWGMSPEYDLFPTIRLFGTPILYSLPSLFSFNFISRTRQSYQTCLLPFLSFDTFNDTILHKESQILLISNCRRLAGNVELLPITGQHVLSILSSLRHKAVFNNIVSLGPGRLRAVQKVMSGIHAWARDKSLKFFYRFGM